MRKELRIGEMSGVLELSSSSNHGDGDGPVISGGLMIERKAVNVVQVCESGVVLKEIPFNLSDSIDLQISAENERID